MTLAAWLQSRTPPAPPALMARVELALGGGLAADLSDVPDECLRAALSLLEPLLDRDEARRECAIDLLAADALVTYGFEAASANVDGLDARAADAMARLALLARGGDDASDPRG